MLTQAWQALQHRGTYKPLARADKHRLSKAALPPCPHAHACLCSHVHKCMHVHMCTSVRCKGTFGAARQAWASPQAGIQVLSFVWKEACILTLAIPYVAQHQMHHVCMGLKQRRPPWTAAAPGPPPCRPRSWPGAWRLRSHRGAQCTGWAQDGGEQMCW